MTNKEFELSIIMPCLNEAETLEICIIKALSFLKENQVSGEIVIGDNGSTDGSIEIANKYANQGVRVINVPKRGYGAALKGAINNSLGKYAIMGDADDSYDFENLNPFLESLRQGNELVMGNRFKGGIEKGAMPPLHKYLGNPVLSAVGKVFYSIKCSDFHCGLRGFDLNAIRKLDLQTSGMEFASEMVVMATLQGLKVSEVPTTLKKDGRSRPPHLDTWRDGWRHLQFLLMYSPKSLFIYPGLFFVASGIIISSLIYFGDFKLFGINLSFNTLLFSSLAILLGVQSLFFGVFSYNYAANLGYRPVKSRVIVILKGFTLNRGVIVGSLFSLLGLGVFISVFSEWASLTFGDLSSSYMRLSIFSFTSLFLGIQIIFSSFFLGILNIKNE